MKISPFNNFVVGKFKESFPHSYIYLQFFPQSFQQSWNNLYIRGDLKK